MQIVFRKLPSPAPPPADGELLVRLAPAYEARSVDGIAWLVLEHGLIVLHGGDQEIREIIVDAAGLHPTLDEMLAATFARRLLQGQPLPEGCKAFAAYTAALRQGLRPTKLAQEETVEGIYLAIRNHAGTSTQKADLTNPTVAEPFRQNWSRLESCILQAAEKGVDPQTASIFTGRLDFARERAFLLRDKDVYLQDVARGEKWRVQIPGGPAESAGLYLVRPNSLFFSDWSRQDRAASVGGSYLFLAVNWGEGVWLFSTDPTQWIRIGALAKPLQKAEQDRDPTQAVNDPWYDGQRPEHDFTLVGSPKAGSRLTDHQVLAIVKKWANAKVDRPPSRILPMALRCALLAMLVCGLTYALYTLRTDPSKFGLFTDHHRIPPGPSGTYSALSGHVLIVDTGPFVAGGQKSLLEQKWLLEHQNDPALFARIHKANLKITLEGKSVVSCDITAALNGVQRKAKRLSSNEDGAEWIVGDFEFGTGARYLTLSIHNPSDLDVALTKVKVDWMPMLNLYGLVVGVGKYLDGEKKGMPSTDFAPKDAEAIAAAFAKQQGRHFGRVKVERLRDPNLGRKDIFDKLSWLHQNADPLGIAVVMLAGHGVKAKNPERFLFAPADFDRGNQHANGITANELHGQLASMKYHAKILILDTCHSGQAVEEMDVGEIRDQSLIVIAACMSQEQVKVYPTWGHSALTLAFLEAFENRYHHGPAKGKRLPRPARGITVDYLEEHLNQRVRQLFDDQSQRPVMLRCSTRTIGSLTLAALEDE